VPPLVELPPKKPPEKKPPPKPKPPDEPPITIGTPPPLLLATAIGGGGGGAKTGGMIIRVTVWVGAAQAVRRTTRRTSRRCAEAYRTEPPPRTLDPECATTLGRAGGFSATWTAPPPTIAPPQVQAQSFAKAILTDITLSPFLAVVADEKAGADPSRLRH
jgi:hypothetical protein